MQIRASLAACLQSYYSCGNGGDSTTPFQSLLAGRNHFKEVAHDLSNMEVAN